MPRFICPHCHHPLATDTLELVHCADGSAWACPCCDELIPKPDATDACDASQASPAVSADATEAACAQT